MADAERPTTSAARQHVRDAMARSDAPRWSGLAPGRPPDRPRYARPARDGRAAAARPSRPATRSFRPASTPRLCQALASRGVTSQPYTHQAEAIEHALAGRNVVVITPTASGKTLCYNAPVLNAILQDPSSRALYLFPTKALAQDQLAELQALCETLAEQTTATQIGVFTYDGDTPQDARRTIRARAHLVLSNPDMVHSGILPHHPRWAKLFENLRYVVIDELHAYRGVFGSHLVQRAAAPAPHLPPLRIESGVPLLVGDHRQSARACRTPDRAAVRAGRQERRAARREVLRLRQSAGRQPSARHPPLVPERDAAHCLGVPQAQLQLIVFAQSRLSTEILTTYLKDDFEGDARRGRADPRLSWRLSSESAPRDREGPARRQRCAPWCRPTRWSSASTSARSTWR